MSQCVPFLVGGDVRGVEQQVLLGTPAPACPGRALLSPAGLSGRFRHRDPVHQTLLLWPHPLSARLLTEGLYWPQTVVARAASCGQGII